MSTHTVEDLTDQTITFEVSLGQHARLERDRIQFDQEWTTHKISIGPYVVPGTWVVTSTQRFREAQPRCFVTMTLLKS